MLNVDTKTQSREPNCGATAKYLEEDRGKVVRTGEIKHCSKMERNRISFGGRVPSEFIFSIYFLCSTNSSSSTKVTGSKF